MSCHKIKDVKQKSTKLSFIEQITEAVGMVSENYWKIVRAGGDIAYRERVFCYELYHCLRKMQEESKFYQKFESINAEIDKRGDRNFSVEYNPDIVFHTQGINGQNACAVEVKVRLDDISGILKDFASLHDLVAKHEYKEGVFLLVNHTLDELYNALMSHEDTLLNEIKKVSINIDHKAFEAISVLTIKE